MKKYIERSCIINAVVKDRSDEEKDKKCKFLTLHSQNMKDRDRSGKKKAKDLYLYSNKPRCFN